MKTLCQHIHTQSPFCWLLWVIHFETNTPLETYSGLIYGNIVLRYVQIQAFAFDVCKNVAHLFHSGLSWSISINWRTDVHKSTTSEDVIVERTDIEPFLREVILQVGFRVQCHVQDHAEVRLHLIQINILQSNDVEFGCSVLLCRRTCA